MAKTQAQDLEERMLADKEEALEKCASELAEARDRVQSLERLHTKLQGEVIEGRMKLKYGKGQ